MMSRTEIWHLTSISLGFVYLLKVRKAPNSTKYKLYRIIFLNFGRKSNMILYWSLYYYFINFLLVSMK